MWRTLVIVLTVPFWGVACGGVVPVPKKDKTASIGPCPKGTEFVRARDVIGPTPAGFEVLPGDRKVLASIAKQFRAGVGKKWRGYDARVLVRRKAAYGTAVMVVNMNERIGSDEKFLSDAMAAERASGRKAEPIRVGGKVGRMQKADDGAFVAMAPAGTCALVVAIADTKKLLHDGTSAMRPR